MDKPEAEVFDLYFSGIVAFQYHPRNPPENRMSLDECAEIARQCVIIRNSILYGG